MPSFSKTSLDRLATCDERIQRVAHEAIKLMDHSVLFGHRNEADQNKAFAEGASTKKWPDSNHNRLPSVAIDVAPYPIDWDDARRFALLAGIYIGIAHSMGIKLRTGLDWDSDGNIKEHTLVDGPHLELVD